MREAKVGVLGRITSGDDSGWFVEVVDDTDASGGFLIVTYEHADRTGSAYGSWVESIIDVDLFFEESNWDIEWLPA